MKSLCIWVVGTIAMICSSMLSANEMEIKNDVSLYSEMLSLPELLSYVENTVKQVIGANDDETCQFAYHELKEGLRVIYTLNCLHRHEASTTLQVLDKCYVDLIDAIDKDPSKANILEQSLSLFVSGHNYDHETPAVQSLQDWTDTIASNELKFAIETTGADLVYIQENAQWDIQKNASTCVVHTPPLILYNAYSFQNSSPKILIIKSSKCKPGDSSEYEAEAGIDMKLGGKDHGKTSFYFKGEVKDKNGNYAKGKVFKEKGDDGYGCEMKAGKKKETK